MGKLNESIWMDIHRRSNGDLERKEDSIDLLDIKGMYDYVRNHYKPTVMEQITFGVTYIKIPIFNIDRRDRSVLLNMNILGRNIKLFLMRMVMLKNCMMQMGIR